MAFAVLILGLCSGLAQAFFHDCSEPGAQVITLERKSIALIDDVGYYYSAAVYMCHNNEYIPVCSNAIRSFEAALVCSTTLDLYATNVPGVAIGNLSDYQPDKYRGPYYKNVTCLGNKIDPSLCHVEVGYDNRSCRGHGGVAVVSCFTEGCEESLVSIDSNEYKIVNTPAFAESISEGNVKWDKNVGDFVKEDEIIAEIETDKYSTASPPTPKESATPPPPPSPPSAPPPPATSAAGPIPTTPPPPPPLPTMPLGNIPPPPPLPSFSAPSQSAGVVSRSEKRTKMSRMRQRIAERLKEAQNVNAMLTTFNEVDMSSVIELRKKFQDAFVKKHGIKLGFMSPFVKAACSALEDQPVVNAVIDNNEIIYRDYIDISVAVATPKGLVVPVVRNVNVMNYADIEKEIASLGQKARDGALAVEDMDGGTFTISNGGVYGSMFGTPIINPPQSAILGMHGVFDRPVAIEGKVEIRPMMYIALTYDHRLIDGREAVLFLRKIKSGVEDPRSLLLDL
uniref:Dihydrolipoyllysine-residue succinyltransferase component of 2-oxoglutarate dehydrogenase complex, mitochondrial n=1 Tax=Amphimedon queenslandica TaxID=400682 RepID=A0A1X7V5P4_AMPQE